MTPVNPNQGAFCQRPPMAIRNVNDFQVFDAGCGAKLLAIVNRRCKRVLLLALGLSVLWMGQPAPAQAPAEITVPVCKTPPQLDADLSDPAWREALKLTGFTQRGTDQPAVAQTTVWICRDKVWFYVAFRCEEPDPGSMRQAAVARDDPVFDDDCVEVFLDNGNAGERYIDLLLSVGNVQADQLWTKGHCGRYWDWPWRSATRIDPPGNSSEGWSAEMAVPLAAIQKGAGAHPWKINFARTRRACAPLEFSSLAAIPDGDSFQAPQRFIPLKGLDEDQAQAAFDPILQETVPLPFSLTPAGSYKYRLKIKVKNVSGCDGAVEVVGRDVPARGEGQQVAQIIALGPVEEKEVELNLPVAAPGPRAAWVGLRKPNTAVWLQKIAVRQMDRLLPLTVYLDRNYYTTETEARLHADITMAPVERQKTGLNINVELMDAKGQVQQTGKAKCLDNEATVPLSLQDVAEGSYQVIATILDGQKRVLGAQDLSLVKRAPAPAGVQEVKIDRYNRCILLNGQPFFPVGVFGLHYFGPLDGAAVAGNTRKAFEVQYQYCKEAGFNTVIDWTGFGVKKPIEEGKTIYDLARQYGLFVIGHPVEAGQEGLFYKDTNFVDNATRAIEGITPYMEMARQHPAVIAYYAFDEPPPELQGGQSIDDVLVNFYKKIHSLDPYHPLYMSLTRIIAKPRWFDTVADLLGSHNYWFPSQPDSPYRGLNRIPQYCEMIDRHANKAHSPTMLGVELELCDDYTLMSPAEQRANTYFALVHGARSLMYFSLPFNHQMSVSQQTVLSQEIHALAPALLTRSPAQEVAFVPQTALIKGERPDLDFPLVQTLLKNRPEGGQLLLAINAARQPVTTRFNVSSLTPRSTVSNWFQGTTLAVSNGCFQETLEPLGTRAYVLTETRMYTNAAVKIHLAMSGPAIASNQSSGPAVVANLLNNGDFEDKNGWQKENFGERETLKRVQEKPHGGKFCLKISKRQVGDQPLDVLSDPLTLKSKTTYRVSGWIRADLEKGKDWPYLLVLKSQGETSDTNAVNISVGIQKNDQVQGEWRQAARQLTTPKGPAQTVRLWCRIPRDCVGEVWFDDLAIEELPSEERERKNLVANSSFERTVLPGWPDHWITPGWLEIAPDPRACGQDEKNPFHGKYCYRITSYRANSWAAQADQYLIGTLTKPGETYTLSVYLRAATDWAPVKLDCFGISSNVTVNAEWQRYVLTGTAPLDDKQWHLRIRSESEVCGNVYVDAVQIEAGAVATPYEE